MSETKTEQPSEQIPQPPELNSATETLPETLKDSENVLPTTEQPQETQKTENTNTNNENNDDEYDDEFSAEDFMLNPPEILKKDHIHELQVSLYKSYVIIVDIGKRSSSKIN